MKKLNVKLLMLLTLMVAFWSLDAFAQKDKSDKKSKTKVVIVKKIKDKNGEVKVERIEKTGAEAEAYLKEQKLDDIKDIDVRIEKGKGKKKVEIIEIDDVDELSDDIKKKLEGMDIKIKMDDSDGEVEIIELAPGHSGNVMFFSDDHHGDGIHIRPTDKIKDQVENLNININNEKHTVDIKMKDGTKKKFEWEGKIPDDTKKELEAMGFEVTKHQPHKKQRIKMRKKGSGKSHSSITVRPSEDKKDDFETIDVKVDDDTKTINVKMKDGSKKTFQWKGELPEDVKKDMEEAGLTVAMMPAGGSGNFWVSKEDGGEPKPFLGVKFNSDNKSDLGMMVDGTVEGSAAEKAGLKKGDILTGINGTTVKDFNGLVKALESAKVGDEVEISYIRGDNTNKVKATLGERKGGSFIVEGMEDVDFEFDSDNSFYFDSDDYDFDFDFDDMKIKEKLAWVGEDRVILGVYPTDDHEGAGTKIKDVVKDGGAEKAGLKGGDIIMSIDGKSINDDYSIGDALKDKKEGDEVKVAYTRDGKQQEAKIALTKSKGGNAIIKFRADDDQNSFFHKDKNKKIIIIRKGDGDEEIEIKKEVIIKKSGDAGDLKMDKVKVFPNPTKDQLTIQFKGEGETTSIVVRDVTGKELYKEELKGFSGDYDKQIDVSGAAAGLLVVSISQGEKMMTVKVLKD